MEKKMETTIVYTTSRRKGHSSQLCLLVTVWPHACGKGLRESALHRKHKDPVTQHDNRTESSCSSQHDDTRHWLSSGTDGKKWAWKQD